MVNLKKNVRNVVTFPYFRKKKELFNIYGLDQRRFKLCELIRNPLIRHSRQSTRKATLFYEYWSNDKH